MRKSFAKLAVAGIIFFLLIVLLICFLKPSKQELQVVVSSGSISDGDSFYSRLPKEGLSSSDISQIDVAFKPFFDTRKCQIGDKFEIVKSTSGDLIKFKYTSGINIYQVEKSTTGKLTGSSSKIDLKEEVVGIKCKIKHSLWETMAAKGLPAELIWNFADIFAWQIDFLTEVWKDDVCKLVWIRRSNDEEGIVIDGKILAAQYQGEKTGKHLAIRFKNNYYNLKGESLRKSFLRAPLSYRRISSRFSYKRFHPILRYVRPHLGIDYAARSGTLVRSIGDGVVVYKGWKGGYGRFIKIRHNSTYTTTYGHLKSYARGIRKGAKVKQGQFIGRVGSTGLSTGPHLDFRMIKNGKFVNFLRLKFPPATKVKKEDRTEFDKIKKKALLELVSLSDEEPLGPEP